MAPCRGRRNRRPRLVNVGREPRGEGQREAILPCEFNMHSYCLSLGYTTNVAGGVCSQAGTSDFLPLQPVSLCCESNTDGTCSHDGMVTSSEPRRITDQSALPAGNRTPVRKPARGYPRVTRAIQLRGIPTMTTLANTRSDHKFPAVLTRFEHARILAR